MIVKNNGNDKALYQQDWLARWSLYSKEKIAVQEHETGRKISYGDLNSLANGIATYLSEQFQITKGDRLAVIAEFSIEYVALFGAAQKLGFIIVPLNFRLTALELNEIILDATPKLILYEEKYSNLINSHSTIVAQTLYQLSSVEPAVSSMMNILQEDDALFIIYTSGTTGKPKGVIYSHKMAFWNSVNTSISLKINTESSTVNVMPPFHTGGWNVLLLPFLHHGGFTYLCNKFDADIVLKKLSELRCTIFMGVPTMLAMLAQSSLFEQTSLSFLDYIIVGGEPMPLPLIEKYADKGVAIRQGYGMTEVGPNLTSLHQVDAVRKKGSIGRPNFYVKHRIVKEDGEEAAVNEAGELWLQGPMVTPGYWNNPVATRDAFSQDGLWFKTGDVVLEDEDNYLFVVDRIKNMYISGAENVYPAEIEKVLKKLPSIKDCAVVGVKDEKWGEAGKAFIVADEIIAEEGIKQHCLIHLAKYKIPKYFVFIEKLPLTDSGKIDRKKLKFL